MSLFYVANCSQQGQLLCYRLPERSSPIQRPVEMGSQISLGDLDQDSAESVIAQFRTYGLLNESEIGRNMGLAPLLFSVGRPVKAESIRKVIAHNRGVLTIRGEDIRKQAAIATSNAITQNRDPVSDAFRAVEMSVQEDQPGHVESGPGYDEPGKPINEGLRVERTSSLPNDPNAGRGRKGKRRAA